MKKYILLLFISTIASTNVPGQIPPQEITKLKNRLSTSQSDSARIELLIELSTGYRFSKIDSALAYAEQAIEESRRIGQPYLEGSAISQRGYILLEAGEIPRSLQDQFTALSIAEEANDKYLEAWCFNRIGNIYMELGEYRKAVDYYRSSKDVFERYNQQGFVYNAISNIGNVYEMMGELDSSKMYQQEVFRYSLKNTDRYAITYAEMRERLGNVERRLGNYDSAIMHYRIGIREALTDFDQRNLAANYLQLAKVFYTQKQYDSSFYYAKKTIGTSRIVSWKKAIYEASGLLTSVYAFQGRPDSALRYAELNIAVRDSLYGPNKIRQLQRISLREQERQLQLQKEKEDLQTKYRTIALLSALGVFLVLVVFLWQNNRKKQIVNRHLSDQKDKISAQRNELEKTLNELKATQSLLIQSEKMASLGELTVGIAHEIQNPLNFVNNFSEVNEDLLTEMKGELTRGKIEEAITLADDALENQKKIKHHGKRADAIVRGMLQHSRTSSGQKERANINALTDEYLRLAYHGLRAKDKSFNATVNKDFDERIGVITIVPQDIGRVILNLLNNAFYTVAEKQRQLGDMFEPAVTVTTKKQDDKVVISVEDNGIGIPQKLLDKIFQPFFTTKPTGQGTGLGLSLSYDIVKAHGGELAVQTQEGVGSVFAISLPLKDLN